MTYHPGNKLWPGLAGLLCLGIAYLLLACTSLPQKSVTIDEFGHLPAGLNLLNSGDFRYCRLNPPLMNALSALPLKLSGISTACRENSANDEKYDFWLNGNVFMNQHRANYHDLFLKSRHVTVLLVGLLGVVVFFWGRLLVPAHPDKAGLLAAALVWFSPDIMGHACLVTTDAGATFFMVLALFTLCLYLHNTTSKLAVLCGITLGMAQLAKFTAVYLYPAYIVIFLVTAHQQPALRTRRSTFQVLIVFIVSILAINLGYGFNGSFQAIGSYQFNSSAFNICSRLMPSFAPIPFPREFLLAFDRQLADTQSGDASFLLGNHYQGGKWYYFAALFAVKTPLPLFILLGLALFVAIRKKGLSRMDSLLILLPAVIVLAMFSFFSNKQLGLRMILPAIALLWIWTGTTLAACSWSFIPNIVIATMLAWLGLETIRICPDYLTYFNQLAGGPEKGHLYAVDSNLDWGQDLPALGDYMRSHKIDNIQLLYFGRVDPEIYGIKYSVPLSGLQPGYLAVSRSLYGRGYFLYDHGALKWAGPFKFDCPNLAKTATLHNTIDIYRITTPGKTQPQQ